MLSLLRRIGSVFTTSISKTISQLCGKQEDIFGQHPPLPGVPPSAARAGIRSESLNTLNTTITTDTFNIANRDIYFTIQHVFHVHDPSSTIQALLEWISSINFRDRHQKHIDARIQDTGRSFLDSPNVRRWIARQYRMLVGTGIPGAGKSILASALVQHIEEQRPCSPGQRCLVNYIFLQRKDALSVTQILAALIRQTLERWPDLITFIGNQLVSCRQHHTRLTLQQHVAALQTLWSQLENVYLIVDGLHEVSEKIRYRLLSIFSDPIANVSLFVTSRGPDLPRTLTPDVTHWIEATKEDVRSLVTLKLKHRCIGGKIFDIELEHVVKAVCKASNGMFLHAKLQLKAMELYLHDREEFTKALQNFPEKLESMYQLILDILDRQPEPAALKARNALHCIIFSQRPLHFDELQYVLATSPTTCQFTPKNIVNEETLLSICCGLVTLDGTPGTRKVVRLFHPSAEPVLRKLLETELLRSHRILASICMATLAAAGIQNSDEPHSLVDLLDSPTTSVSSTSFLRYAYDNWAFHARRASKPDNLKQFLLRCTSFPVKGDLLGPLHVAAYYNLLSMEGFTWEGAWDARTAVKGKTALMLAAGEGHRKSVKVLLADRRSPSILNATDSANRTALTYASQGGHSKVVKRLLQYPNIKLDVVDEAGKTAITTAQTSGHEKVVVLLYKAEVQKSNNDLRYRIRHGQRGGPSSRHTN